MHICMYRHVNVKRGLWGLSGPFRTVGFREPVYTKMGLRNFDFCSQLRLNPTFNWSRKTEIKQRKYQHNTSFTVFFSRVPPDMCACIHFAIGLSWTTSSSRQSSKDKTVVSFHEATKTYQCTCADTFQMELRRKGGFRSCLCSTNAQV